MYRNLQSVLLLIVLALPMSLLSQQVNNSIFPVPGDTLRTTTTTQVGAFDKTLIGENLTWDVSDLGTGFVNTTIYVDPSEGESSDLFPDADLLDINAGQEIYYRSFNNKIIEIGRAGLDPVLNAIELSFENEGEAVLRRAPMSYNDLNNDNSSFLIAASAAIVPDTILGPLAGSVDSLRLLVETSNEDYVDAWGTLTTPTGEYDVVRVKRTTTTDVTLEAKVVVLDWVTVDPSNPLFAALGDLLSLLGESTTVSYQFFANDNKEIIASFDEDVDGNITSVTYKGENISTSTNDVGFENFELVTYPNPTYGNITFELTNLPKGNYSVHVHNIIGAQIWSSPINKNGTLTADLSHLRKGTYLYSIMDDTGRKLTTRRLMIITP